MRTYRLLLWLLALTLPGLALAQDEVVDFAGTITSSTVVAGTEVPVGYTVPTSFTGSFLYNPTSTTNAGLITDVTVNVGSSIVILKNFSGCVCLNLVTSNSFSFEDSGSLGLAGPVGPLELNEFGITFSNPTSGMPVDAHNVDFTGFNSATMSFNAGGNPRLGEGTIAASGKITMVSVAVPEPGPLPLMLTALAGIALIRLRLSRGSI